MKHISFFLLLLSMPVVSQAQQLPDLLRDYVANGVERIERRSNRGSVVYEYENGLLRKKTEPGYASSSSVVDTYDYEITDTLWTITETNSLIGKRYTKVYFHDGRCDSLVYTSTGTVWRMVPVGTRFASVRDDLYRSGVVRCYCLGDTIVTEERKEEYKMNELNKVLYEGNTIVYESRETVYDADCKNKIMGAIIGVPVWSEERPDKLVIVYSDLDSLGNWRKMEYLTEKGRVLGIKREIKYVGQ